MLSGGLKLYPEELEQKIDLSKNFILAGRDNPILGQELLLIIESEQPLNEQHRIAALARLDRLERPKKILYLKSFIYTSNGKIKRTETLSQALSLGPNKG